MGRGIPAALLGRRLKQGAHSNRKDGGVDPTKAALKPEAEAPEAEAPEAEAPEVSMNNTKAELIAAAEGMGLETKGMTKAQILAAIEAAQ